MVIIELFDYESPMDNALSSLRFDVEKVIFVGRKPKAPLAFIPRLKKILDGRGIGTELLFRKNTFGNVDGTAGFLMRLVNEYPDCAIDLTGGEDISLIAAGMLQERMDHVISMYSCNVLSNVPHVISGEIPPLRIDKSERTFLTVEELAILFGGCIVPRSEDHPDGSVRWSFTEGMMTDFRKMWELNKTSPGKWNYVIDQLAWICSDCDIIEERMPVLTITTESYLHQLQQRHLNNVFLQKDSLLRNLSRLGLLDCSYADDVISFRFKDGFVYECLTKAGTIWEMKLFLELSAFADKDGNPYFDDIMTGVLMDWDGRVEDLGTAVPDIQNEIDIVALRGMQPYFISAKNGRYENTELYKLDTVSEQFGGKYVIKSLFASQKYPSSPAMDACRARADAMQIRLFEGCSEENIRRNLRRLIAT